MLTVTVIGTMGPLGAVSVDVHLSKELTIYVRECDYCGHPYVVAAPHQRFCDNRSCRSLYSYHRIDQSLSYLGT